MSELDWQFAHSYRTLPPRFYAPAVCAGFPNPHVLVFNTPLAHELGLLADGADFDPQTHADVLCGNRFPAQAHAIAQAYAGHQFGHFAVLGDGRATLIGEQRTPNGTLADIQLKGNGRTPYSRRGDGKAALAPMLREYLISEAMHALGIPTTRSLAVVRTGERVYRPHWPDGAVLVRTAQSHIRVGTFQFAALGGEVSDVRALADYTLARHFPDPPPEAQASPYCALLHAVVARQARLTALWQWAGFVHGVMNTDNSAIAGETLDYGPCAFLDNYHPDTVFSSIDHHGRYRYANQAPMAQWNMARLAETLLPLLDADEHRALEQAYAAVNSFMPAFEQHYRTKMAQRLGFADNKQAHWHLVERLLHLMMRHRADYTNTFARLTLAQSGNRHTRLDGTDALFAADDFAAWHQAWQQALQGCPSDTVAERMRTANPAVIPRNAHVETALAAAEKGDMQPFHDLLAVLQQPFRHGDETCRVYQHVPAQDEPYRTFCGT